jgi:hypothetical protein
VIITAAVAMTGVTGGDVGEAWGHLEQRLAGVTERARRRQRRGPVDHSNRGSAPKPEAYDRAVDTTSDVAAANDTCVVREMTLDLSRRVLCGPL